MLPFLTLLLPATDAIMLTDCPGLGVGQNSFICCPEFGGEPLEFGTVQTLGSAASDLWTVADDNISDIVEFNDVLMCT